MEIRQLLTFIRVVQFQSFSKAADSLGYSQSAVTIQIKNLEQDLNTHLFDRVGKRVTLTPEGERFLPYAYNIINETNSAKRALTESHELTGSLKIGTVESLCFSKLPAILNEMRRLHPKVSIQIRVSSPEGALAMMEHNEIDLVYLLDDPHYNFNFYKAMEIPEDISPFIFYLFLAFFFLIFLAFALLRVYVGLAARAEGMGKRRGVGYLVWACLFFCLQILFLVLILLVLLRVGIAEGSYLQIFSTIFMEFSSAAILGEMIVAAVRLKALRRRKAG